MARSTASCTNLYQLAGIFYYLVYQVEYGSRVFHEEAIYLRSYIVDIVPDQGLTLILRSREEYRAQIRYKKNQVGLFYSVVKPQDMYILTSHIYFQALLLTVTERSRVNSWVVSSCLPTDNRRETSTSELWCQQPMRCTSSAIAMIRAWSSEVRDIQSQGLSHCHSSIGSCHPDALSVGMAMAADDYSSRVDTVQSISTLSYAFVSEPIKL